MFDSLNDSSGPLFEESGGEITASDRLTSLLEASEQPRHALLSDSIDHETQGRTTTVKPDGNHDAYLIVTDERVLVIMGDQPETIEIEFDLLSISRCNLKSGFLSTTLIIGHSDESIRFSPTDGDPDVVSEDIELLSNVYSGVESSIRSAEDFTEEFETRLREAGTEGEIVDVTRLRLRVQSQLSEARHLAKREDGVPTGKLLERINKRKSEFEKRHIDTWIERADRALETAQAATTDGDFETFCLAYTTATGAVASLNDALDDMEDVPGQVSDDVRNIADRTDDVAEEYVEATQAAYEAAIDATDSETAGTKWLETYHRLSAARTAGWNETDESADLPLEDIASVAEETVTALQSHAAELEESGDSVIDDDPELAREHFEAAIEHIQKAGEIASDWESIDELDYEARLEALNEQIEVTEWEWGGD